MLMAGRPRPNHMSPITKVCTAADLWPEATERDRWIDIVRHALQNAARKDAFLSELYMLIEMHPRTKGQKHWRAKVRQTLQQSPMFVRVAPGCWGLAENFDVEHIQWFAQQRRKQCPRKTDREG